MRTYIWDKFDAWRHFAMLSKPSTHIRNLQGNALFSKLETASDKMAAVIEKALIKDPNQRTKTLGGVDKNLVEACEKDANNNAYRQLKDNKYSEGNLKGFIQQNVTKTFKEDRENAPIRNFLGKATNFGVNKNSELLDKEDTWAAIKKYKEAQAGFLTARGLNAEAFDLDAEYEQLASRLAKMTNLDADLDTVKARLKELEPIHNNIVESRKYAIRKAQEATFHDNNKLAEILSEGINKLKHSDSGTARTFGRMAEGVITYRKTPGNILKQGGNYSPLGTIKTLPDLAVTLLGQGTSEQAVNAAEGLAKSITGTGLMAVGGVLGAAGIVKANKLSGVEGTENVSPYSLNIAGKSIPIDFLAPAALPVLMGAQLYELQANSENGVSIEDFCNSLLSISDPLVETTMLDGINDMLKTISYVAANRNTDSEGIGSALASAMLNAGVGYYTQAVPGILGSVTKGIDLNRRTSGDTETTGLVGQAERMARGVASKVPGLSELNNKYVDVWGRTDTNGANAGTAIAKSLLMPTYINQVKEEPVDAALKAIESEGYNAIPKKPGRTVDNHRLSNKEWEATEIAAGQFKRQAAELMVNSPEFKSFSPEQQSEMLQKVYNLGNKVGYSEGWADYSTKDKDFNNYKENGLKTTIQDMLTKEADQHSVDELNSKFGTNIQANTYREKIEKGMSNEEIEKFAKDTADLKKLNDEFGTGTQIGTYQKMLEEGKSEAEIRETFEAQNKSDALNEKYGSDVDVKSYRSMVKKGYNDAKIEKYYSDSAELKKLNDEYGTSIEVKTYQKKKEEGLSDDDMRKWLVAKGNLDTAMDGVEGGKKGDKVAALNKTNLTPEEKGAALMSEGEIGEATQKAVKSYGDSMAWYIAEINTNMDGMGKDAKATDKKAKGMNYINSLNISENQKGALALATIATGKRYEQAKQKFGDAAVYQLFNHFTAADTNGNGYMTIPEVQAYRKKAGLSKEWVDLLYGEEFKH